jgi:hypothetical protein
MRVSFMYDGHTFARVGDIATPRSDMEKRAAELFMEDGCGSLFARDASGERLKPLHGHRMLNGRWGVDDSEISAFFDQVDEHINWLARG